ncbi:MAG: DUF502 domain-containing protein [Candidatus Aminicenantes bacterium]|nr:DUF502 domain-containing protein [Candidatus Aminicenantes bacterium]
MIKSVFSHLKKFIFRGFLAIIPLFLTYLLVRFLYLTIDKRVVDLIAQIIGFRIPGLGIILFILIFYMLGLVVSNWFGKRVFDFIERLTSRIPLIGTTYQVGKQLEITLTLPEKHIFKRAVLVEYLKPGIWTIGFVTGEIRDRKNDEEKILKVFIPTPPNPMSGTMVLVKESQVRDPGWTIKEALNAVISGGILGPGEIL